MRRHTANRDRHVLRVGLHRRSHHHRHSHSRRRRRFAASRGRRRRRMRVAGCGGGASAPPRNSPCVRAGASPPLGTHSAFGHTSSQFRANRRRACRLSRDRSCASRSLSISPSLPLHPRSSACGQLRATRNPRAWFMLSERR